MADQFGYRKGAKGIDTNHGEDFATKHIDNSAIKAMYGRSHGLGQSGGKGEVSSTFGGREGQGSKGKSIPAMAKSAVKGKRKLGS